MKKLLKSYVLQKLIKYINLEIYKLNLVLNIHKFLKG